MIVYEATKQDFLQDVFTDELVNSICSSFNEKIGKVNEAEIRSWDNSMQYMYRVLHDDSIPDDSGVAIEFRIPYTSKRVDFLISGRNDSQDSVVIVELKQWGEVEKVEGKEAIVKTLINRGIRETAHPSYQAWSYAALIEDYNQVVQDQNIQLKPCAYAHNYIRQEKNDQLTDPIYQYYLDKAPVFSKGDAPKLREFIKKYIKYGDNKELLYDIERGRIRPSKSLQDSLGQMLKGNQEFIMIDEQKVVYEEAITLAKKAAATGRKQVLVVNGGPGTGKSVLAINLLVEMTRTGLVAQYVTKNSAPRNVYATKLKGDFRKTRIDNLFKGSGSYTQSKTDEIDALIVDEAHRLNEKSGLFQNLGENQIKEVINASKFSIFFIDENQRVTLKDVGSINLIKYFSNSLEAEVTQMELTSQFRCDGSDAYLAWLDDVLEIRETANSHFYGLDYDFRIYDDPNTLFEEIVRLNHRNNKSRLVSGYCWNWENKNDSEHKDITIPEHKFGISWNLGNTETWAIDEQSVQQAGCIHTCQGLEFDYVGVIIGDDLTFSNGQVMTDYTKRAKTDQSLRGIKKMMKTEPERAIRVADEIIRNTYRTLMTRGQKGCFIYCTDPALASYFKDRLERTRVYSNSMKTDMLRVAENPTHYNN
ncbi:DNA/RNA helicase domain-containing protein [Bhargavaea ginsengi]|uniref:DNA/RNA helicase domain-containing protein n=1 Tax=Bhargavaea ginsengi TaxID=426757 RepID=UPI003C71A51B